MPRYRKPVRRTLGKEPRRMSSSLIDDNTAGTASIIIIAQPVLDQASVGTGDVYGTADSRDRCAPNALIKYLNIRLESGVRDVSPAAPGFIEYAVVVFENSDIVPIVDARITAGLGTQTLGDLCVNLFKGHCLWNGAFAVSKEIPGVADIKIKIPNKWCKCKNGMFFMLIKASHTLNVADTTTDFRTFYSHQYKLYV